MNFKEVGFHDFQYIQMQGGKFEYFYERIIVQADHRDLQLHEIMAE